MRLNALLVAARVDPLDAEQTGRFEEYLSLLVRWNARINLTAVRDEDGSRLPVRGHFQKRSQICWILARGEGFPGFRSRYADRRLR